jgi:hypothetical protein
LTIGPTVREPVSQVRDNFPTESGDAVVAVFIMNAKATFEHRKNTFLDDCVFYNFRVRNDCVRSVHLRQRVAMQKYPHVVF